MRIINTFADLDLLERFHPVCINCQRKAVPLYQFKPDDSVLDFMRRQAWLSNDLRGPIEVGKVRMLPFKGVVY